MAFACPRSQSGVTCTWASPAAATRPATIAAEEDPRPRPCGMVLRQPSQSPGALDPKISEADERGPDDQVALIPRQLGRPFPRDLDLIALFDHRQVDPLSPVEREPKAVESRSEVGAGSWDLHRHRVPGLSTADRRLGTHHRSLKASLEILVQQAADRRNGEQIRCHDFGMNRTESR